MSIFKSCDIRGVVGDGLDAAVVRRIGRSLGQMVRRRGGASICVGGDFRSSTPPLKTALTGGLTEAGISVHDVGQSPTPVVCFAARHLGLDSFAIVTASHNPSEYNGIKFSVAGRPAVPELIGELRDGLDAPVEGGDSGNVVLKDVCSDYEAWVAKEAKGFLSSCADLPPTVGRKDSSSSEPKRMRRLHVVLDSMSGAFTNIAPRVLMSMGYRVTSLCSRIDPDFLGNEPNPARDPNLQTLVDRIGQEHADIGIALDGDGDRVIFVDHAGAIVRPEQIAALFVKYCFERPTVVYDVKCASVLPRAVESAGGRAIVQPSGYGFIKTTMIDRRADMGVEVSGHHFFGVLGGGDDGLFTALVVSGLMEMTGSSLTDLVKPIGWPAITRDLRVPFQGDPADAVEAIASSCGGQLTRLDGVRTEYDDGWALARPSITEPAITFRFEGRDGAHMREIASRFLAGVPELGSRVMEMIDD
ncbi:MAG: hypothetical protein ISR77_30460 [Pirellulaceae bacterium]|nr:hypothetical protein [Pirellulaceae bacterium]